LRHGDDDESTLRLGIAQNGERVALPRNLVANDVKIVVEDLEVVGALTMKAVDKSLALVPMVEVLDRLFEPDGDEDAEDHNEQVSEEFAARHGRVLGRVNVDHRGVLRSGGDDMSREGGL